MATNYWQQALADVQSGKRTDFTPLAGNIPSFQDWMAPRQSFYGAQNAALADGRIGFREGMGQNFSDNPAEYDYLRQFYNVPSYDKSQFGNVALAGMVGGGFGLASLAGAPAAAGAANAAIPVGGAIEGTAPLASMAAGSPMAAPLATGAGAGALSAGASMIPGVPNNVLAGVLQGGLGYLGSRQVSNAYENVANQNLALGGWARDLNQQSYAPGFDLASQPGYGDALQRMADISARSYSAKFGNPADSPSAQAGILNDVWSQNYLPALSNYRGGLMQAGGQGLNTSGAAQLGGAANAGMGMNAIGYGLGTILNPTPSFEDTMRMMQQYGMNPITIGGVRY